jgi:hypothetical protein
VRINPVGLSRVPTRRNAMGIVRPGERNAARIVTKARTRRGREESKDPPRIGRRLVVVGASALEIVPMDGARHSGPDLTRVRAAPPSQGDQRRAS